MVTSESPTLLFYSYLFQRWQLDSIVVNIGQPIFLSKDIKLVGWFKSVQLRGSTPLNHIVYLIKMGILDGKLHKMQLYGSNKDGVDFFLKPLCLLCATLFKCSSYLATSADMGFCVGVKNPIKCHIKQEIFHSYKSKISKAFFPLDKL